MKFDAVVVGSGIAGLSFALKSSKLGHKVAIITKKERSDTNTNHAQGGIASVTSCADDFDSHVKDTLIAGDGLCNEAAVRAIVSAGPRQIKDLIEEGVEFTSLEDGSPSLGREGGPFAAQNSACQGLYGARHRGGALEGRRRRPEH